MSKQKKSALYLKRWGREFAVIRAVNTVEFLPGMFVDAAKVAELCGSTGEAKNWHVEITAS